MEGNYAHRFLPLRVGVPVAIYPKYEEKFT